MAQQTDVQRIAEESSDEKNARTVCIWFDGACPGNGIKDERAGYGLVFGYESDDNYQRDSGKINYGTDVTTPVADYKALINGLRLVKEAHDGQHPFQVNIYGDAEPVIRQVNGQYNVNARHLTEYRREARELLGEFEGYSIEYVCEDDSVELQEADLLANEAAESSNSLEVEKNE